LRAYNAEPVKEYENLVPALVETDYKDEGAPISWSNIDMVISGAAFAGG
jgi:hypothetical protein